MRKIARAFAVLLCALPAFAQNETTLQIDSLSMTGMELELDQSVVVSERKYMVYKLDKKTISAATDIFAAGGSAIDILENTPSVRVDAEGELTFRGSSGFKVYVNGKPAIGEGSQALEQIPASSIENIEIITVPSARYESDGDVGIINVITKKDTAPGINGAINQSFSTLGSFNLDAIINRNVRNHRWYAGVTALDIRSRSDFHQEKTTTMDGITARSVSDGPRRGIRQRFSGKIGYEFDNGIDNFLLELEGGYTNRVRTGDMDYSDQRFFTASSALAAPASSYISHDVYSLDENIAILNTAYTHKFNDAGHKISASYYAKYDWNAMEYYESNMFDAAGGRVDGSLAYESEHRWNRKGYLDYTLPYGESGKFEAGYEYSRYIEDGDYSIKFWDRATQQYNWRDDLYNIYYYCRTMNSLYAQWSDRFGPLTLQAGLRADHRHDYLNITMSGASRDIRKWELFPSAHAGYTFPDGSAITLGYSYRVNRPNIWQLEPYITYEDYYTAMVGNPDILPEFINAYELNLRKNFGEANTVSATVFYRDRKDKMDRIRVAYLPGVTLDSLANVGLDKSAGVELSAQLRLARNWSLIANGSAYYYDFRIYNPAQGRDATSFNYEALLGNTFTLSPTTRLQFDANLVGPAVSSQGRQDPYFYANLSLRQQFLKRKLTTVLAFRDIFATAHYNNRREADNIISLTRIRPIWPNITLTLSYTFNEYRQADRRADSGELFEGSQF